MSAWSAAAASVSAAAARPARSVPGAGDRRPAAVLRLVPRAHSRAPRAPFVVLVLALLGAGLVGLLYLTTSMEQGAFRLQTLQHTQAQLANQEQALQGQLQAASAPAAIAARAQALGMIPDDHPAYVRYPDGLITGDTPLAGQHLHLAAVPADHIVIGAGGPTAAPVPGAQSGGLPGAATPATPATPATTKTPAVATSPATHPSPAATGSGSPAFLVPTTPRSTP